MSWKPMETAPKDGTVIVVYVEYRGQGPKEIDVLHAFYNEAKGTWDSAQDDMFFQLQPLQIG